MSEVELGSHTVAFVALDQHVLAVAVEGDVGDWAAYIGAVEGKSHVKEFLSVASKGTKLPKWIAEGLFPEWRSKPWRE